MFTRAKKILASELMYALEKDEDEAEAHLDDLLATSARERRSGRGRVASAEQHRWRSRSSWPPAAANALAPTGPRRSSRWRAGRCSSGASTRCARRGDRATIVVALPPGDAGARRARSACAGGADALGSRCARALRGGARRRRRCVVHDAARPLVTPELVAARARGAAATARRRDRRRAGDRHDQGGRRRRRGRRARSTARALWAVQTPQVFRRAALERALDVAPTTCSPRPPTTPGSSSARAARCASSSPRPTNLKVTTPHDLRVAELLLAERALTRC